MVNVIGLGYIGLPTALMMASHGVEVVGTDCNMQLVETLQQGRLTFKEKGLDELFRQALEAGIRFTDTYQVADVYVIAVPTPYDAATKQVDTTYVMAALQQVRAVAPENAVVVIESTISPGTIDRVVRPALEGALLHLVHAPERILPGNMIAELQHNHRTIGADSPEVGERVKRLYATFCQGDIVLTDIRSAEMSKVVENSFRAVNIAFANELARICRHEGMDVYEIIRLCNMHPRVNILQPGPGVGGHCIAVDPWFLVGDFPQLARVIGECMRTNESQPAFVWQRIGEIMLAHHIADNSRVGLYGLTYKEDVDDCRDAPTLQLLSVCRERGGDCFRSYDPYFEGRSVTEGQVTGSFEDFLSEVDMVVVMVGHTHIRQHWSQLESKVVLDCRNVFPSKAVYHI